MKEADADSGPEEHTRSSGRLSTVSSRRSDASSVVETPRKVIAWMLSGFDACIGVVILANAVAIGAEQSFELAEIDISAFAYLEHFFLTMYVLELFIRCVSTGGKCFSDNWVRFDAFLVGTSVLCFWIIPPVMGNVQGMGMVSMVRMLRLLRLARSVRLIKQFRELWMLVQGLLVSARTMVYTITLIVVILYLFSVVAVEVITKHHLARREDGDPTFHDIVEHSFNTLPQTMMTLMQFVSFDNVVLIYEPLIKRDWRLALFFISIIVIVGILLMNLVTAVVVNNALEQAMADKELVKKLEDNKKRKMCKELRKLFFRLDVDASGHISMDEIARVSDEDRQMLVNIMGMSDPLELFQALDCDGSGEVDIDEFIKGLWQVCTSKAPIEIKRVEKMVEAMQNQMRASQSMMADMVREMSDLKYQFDLKLSRSSLSASAALPGGPDCRSIGGTDVRQSKSGSSVWDQTHLIKEVEADCDGHLASGTPAGREGPHRDVAAAAPGSGAGAAAQAWDARPGSRQTADEMSPSGPDISAAMDLLRALTCELRACRAAGATGAAMGEAARAGSALRAPGLRLGRAVTRDVLYELTKAARPSDDLHSLTTAPRFSSSLGDLSPTRPSTGAPACDGHLGLARWARATSDPRHAPGDSTTGVQAFARQPAPKDVMYYCSAPLSGTAASMNSSPRSPWPPQKRPAARTLEASAPMDSAPQAATAAHPRAAHDSAGGPPSPAGRAAQSGCVASGPALVHHL
ncbi:unnamed protein product [Prorocentrum cordatum]|uniref:EF-hand domain-containing protein n=1 Tax=Prorocentrum cordatum TaxID=2364126 RepID=A0ABN9QS78_9DINO|nr:unnamed protein product [Polarella glacialis]